MKSRILALFFLPLCQSYLLWLFFRRWALDGGHYGWPPDPGLWSWILLWALGRLLWSSYVLLVHYRWLARWRHWQSQCLVFYFQGSLDHKGWSALSDLWQELGQGFFLGLLALGQATLKYLPRIWFLRGLMLDVLGASAPENFLAALPWLVLPLGWRFFLWLLRGWLCWALGRQEELLVRRPLGQEVLWQFSDQARSLGYVQEHQLRQQVDLWERLVHQGLGLERFLELFGRWEVPMNVLYQFLVLQLWLLLFLSSRALFWPLCCCWLLG